MDLRGRKSINRAVLLWVAAALLLLIMATPALSVIFAAPGSVNTKAIVNKAVKTKKIANGAVNSAKIADGSIANADVAAGAAIAASKINRSGLDADLLDGKDAGDFVDVETPSWTPQVRRLSVPPSAWVLANQGSTSADSIANRGSFAYDVNGGRMVAPVYLPDAAKITEVRVFYSDSDAGTNLRVALFRHTMTAGFPWAWISQWVQSTGSSGALESAFESISPSHVVNNGANVYFLAADFTSSARTVQAVVITYTVDSP